jgi:hypothetical protein
VEEGVNLQAMLILTIKGDKAYIISYNAEPTKFSYYLPTLQKMINSFQITKLEAFCINILFFGIYIAVF